MFRAQYILLLMALVSFSGAVYSQSYYWQSAPKKAIKPYITLEAGPGVRMYAGDIQQPGELFNKVNLAYHLGVRYQWREKLGLAFSGGGRKYRGYKEFAYPGAFEEMNGSLWEGQLLIQYNWVRWEDFTRKQFTARDPVSKLNAFIASGGGASLFNASYESNYISSADSLVSNYTGGSGSGFAFYVPVILGFRYRFNREWSLGIEFQHHIYFSDNLDGRVSAKNDSMESLFLKLGYTFK